MSQFDTENKDVLLAMALAAGASASDAARQLELSLSTVKRRMADPDFRQFVSELRAQMLERALGRVTDNMTQAADTLVKLLNDPSPAIQIRASRALLTLGLRLHDAVDLANRVHEVEAELARRQEALP
jgi:hypothetical protein